MNHKEVTLFRTLFVIAAFWNLAGGILGYFNPAYSFDLLFGRELADPLFHAIYKGACGTTLIYFIGYLVVAFDPLKHTGIVLVGGIGKVGYATQLLKFYLGGLAGPSVFVVIIGDFIFALLFIYFYFRLFKTGSKILSGTAKSIDVKIAGASAKPISQTR